MLCQIHKYRKYCDDRDWHMFNISGSLSAVCNSNVLYDVPTSRPRLVANIRNKNFYKI